MSNESVPETRAAKLARWSQAKLNASEWTAIENRLRRELFDEAFPAPEVGTNKIRIGALEPGGPDMALVGVHKLSYSIDAAALEAAKTANLLPMEEFDKLFRYDVKLRDAIYRELSEDKIKVFAPFVTEKPASPTIEVKLASAVRW